LNEYLTISGCAKESFGDEALAASLLAKVEEKGKTLDLDKAAAMGEDRFLFAELARIAREIGAEYKVGGFLGRAFPRSALEMPVCGRISVTNRARVSVEPGRGMPTS
jgi:hypothetical protein